MADGGFFDGILSSILGGGGQEGSLGNILAALGTSGVGAYAAVQGNKNAQAQSKENLALQLEDKEKDRALQRELLAMNLAAKGGGGGGGGGDGAAMANVNRQKVADASNATAQGAQLKQSALELFLRGILGGYGKGL